MQRLAKILAKAGIASRRKAEKLIVSQRVAVNGKTVFLPETRVDLEKDLIEIDGQKVQSPEEKHYFLFHKPKNVLCSDSRRKNEVLINDYFRKMPSRLFTAGRLDKDVTGLIIVTNDGYFANCLMHPSFQVKKEYLAWTREKISAQHLKIMQQGVFLKNRKGRFVKVKPLKIERVSPNTCKITVADGQKHEVKLLLRQAALGLKSLCRIRIGPFYLGRLPQGRYRQIGKKEIEGFFAGLPKNQISSCAIRS